MEGPAAEDTHSLLFSVTSAAEHCETDNEAHFKTRICALSSVQTQNTVTKRSISAEEDPTKESPKPRFRGVCCV